MELVKGVGKIQGSSVYEVKLLGLPFNSTLMHLAIIIACWPSACLHHARALLCPDLLLQTTDPHSSRCSNSCTLPEQQRIGQAINMVLVCRT